MDGREILVIEVEWWLNSPWDRIVMNKHLVSDSNQRLDGMMHGRGGGD